MEGRVLNIFIINYEPTNSTANTRPLRQVFPWLIDFITSLVWLTAEIDLILINEDAHSLQILVIYDSSCCVCGLVLNTYNITGNYTVYPARWNNWGGGHF